MSLALVALGLALLGACRTDPEARSRILLGALSVGFAATSLTAVGFPAVIARPDAIGLDGLRFLQVAAGILLLGFGAAWSAGWSPSLILLTVVAAVTAWSLFAVTGWLQPVGFAAGLLAAVVFGWLLVLRLRPGRLLVAIDRGLLDPGERSAWRPDPAWVPTAPVVAAGGATLIGLLIPHLWTVLGGVVVAVVTVFVALRQSRRRAWPLLGVATVVALTLLWMVRLSGPLGGWIPDLIDGPFSPRAAQVLAVMVGLAGAGLAGAWPLHGLMVPVLLAPMAVAVGGVVGGVLVPDGVQWLQPILAPIALVGMLHAIAWRRLDQWLIVAGMYGIWTGTREGAVGGAMLIGTGWLRATLPATWLGRLPIPAAAACVAMLAPAGGILGILRGGLGTETVYAALATLVTGVAILVFAGEARPTPVAPRP